MQSFFAMAQLGYKESLYLDVTARNDWSSTLPIDNRSYFYPSVSGSFVFTELFSKNDILTFGKVRASWAQVGKDANAYATLTYLETPITFAGEFGSYGYGCVVCSVGKHQANGSGDKHTLYVHVQINIALVILLGLDIGGATLYGDTT